MGMIRDPRSFATRLSQLFAKMPLLAVAKVSADPGTQFLEEWACTLYLSAQIWGCHPAQGLASQTVNLAQRPTEDGTPMLVCTGFGYAVGMPTSEASAEVPEGHANTIQLSLTMSSS